MGDRKWVFAPQERALAGNLARALRISPVTAQVLINRGIREPNDAKAFLQPELPQLHEPSTFTDMPKAVERIQKALRENEKIGIFGDYDVDGTTATSILVRYLRMLGHEAMVRIPNRVSEGYGLNP